MPYIFRVKFKAVITALLATALILSASSVTAEELVISGNGSSSDSQITITSVSTTSVEQVNQASIQNDVSLNANTGENSASDNTNADTSITTGGISFDTSAQNNANLSAFLLDCCQEPPSTIMIIDNGADSQNTVNFNQNSNTQINIVQNAQIQNNVSGNVNTGENQANDNSEGDISITTGSISVNSNIENKNINVTSVSVPFTDNSLNINISGNGFSSNNLVNASLNNEQNISINNKADILNNSIWDLITGKNQANGNTGGNIFIGTGDINATTEITNGPININLITADCCNDPDVPSDPDDPGDPDDPEGEPLPPTNQPPSSSSNLDPGSSAPSNGQVLAAATSGQVLPATGMSWTVTLTLASLIMFLMGLYLRLHPGQDPGKI